MFTAAANRRYTTRTVVCWAAYLAMSAIAVGQWFEELDETIKLAFGAAVALPVAAHVWATWALVQEADEFARAVALKRFVIAWGVCLGLAAGWGFAESFANAVHVSGQFLYPVFWVVFLAISPFVNASR